MKNFIRNTAILLSPIMLMVLINELVRPTLDENTYTQYGIHTMNTNRTTPDYCSWSCHNNTTYCKEHHVKFLQGSFKKTDPLYFGMIDALQLVGNYAVANIIFLVLAGPVLIWFLIIKTLNMHVRIKKLKNHA